MAARYDKLLELAKLELSELVDAVDKGYEEDVESAYAQTDRIIKQLKAAVEQVREDMLNKEETLDEIIRWTNSQKREIKTFQDLLYRSKERLSTIRRERQHEEIRLEIEKQRSIAEEVSRIRRREEEELNELSAARQRREHTLKADISAGGQFVSKIAPSVKLQKYVITPFSGDFKDWLRFWNQFSVEVDASGIADISKFHYLLELLKGQPREDITGLPHTVEGYAEAKRILVATYGKDIKVHRALIKEIESLPYISSTHKLPIIHEFFNKLSRAVRSLNTMNKLDSAQGLVYTIMDKLGPIREILAQTDDDWEKWKIEDLVESLHKYVDRNPLQSPVTPITEQRWADRNSKLLMENQVRGDPIQTARCVYCGATYHRSVACHKFLTVAGRREILKRKKLCFNCTGGGHDVASCRSRSCTRCGQKHHTSLCDKQLTTLPERVRTDNVEKNLSASNRGTSTLHPTVKASLNGTVVRIMVDTGAGSSYICSDIIAALNLQPIRRETRCIEQMFGTVTRKVEVYLIEIQSIAVPGFTINVECVNAEKGILTYLPNPRISHLKERFRRLRQLPFSDEADSQSDLPIHVILGAADFQRIRTTERPVLGNNPDIDPGAEFTKLGWIVFGRSLSSNVDNEKHFFLRSSKSEFEQLCSLDVLGISDVPTDNSTFHTEFKENLEKSDDGFYTTRLPWKPDHPLLPENRKLTEARLRSTTRRLEKQGILNAYDSIMQEQLSTGILEPVPEQQTGEIVHYIPHHGIVKEKAETSKLRIVYDCSAKSSYKDPSLNDCLETGPALQPLLFDILMRNSLHYYCITGDIEKAFHQIRVSPMDRDAQRVLWYNNLRDRRITEYRFTRVIFGAAPSPYILGATLQKHVSLYTDLFPETARLLLANTYVDDLQAGGETLEQLLRFKEEATHILGDGGFKLHKWHSNYQDVDGVLQLSTERNANYQSTVAATADSDSTILGVPWDTRKDTIEVSLSSVLSTEGPITKRKVLSAINGIYDVLGLVSPISIVGKLIFSEVCLTTISWDSQLPVNVCKKWDAWISGIRRLPYLRIPRCVVNLGTSDIVLHGFSDASKQAVCATIYVVASYEKGPPSKHLLVSRSRIAPKDLSIPRLELVASHTLAKLLKHTIGTLHGYSIKSTFAWTDSTTVLYWLRHHGSWSRYVRNRVAAIHETINVEWNYVPTNENPSDLGTRGVTPENLGTNWFNGPSWKANREQWPRQPDITATTETNTEHIQSSQHEQARVGVEEVPSLFVSLLDKHSYWKLLRVTSFIRRFLHNCRTKEKMSGPLTTEEIETAEKFWIRCAQTDRHHMKSFDLRVGEDNLLRLHGRVAGYHPIFIPRSHKIAELITMHYHVSTFHGGVQTIMSKVRTKFWIPQMRQLAKSVSYHCNLCKKIRAKPISSPATAVLPEFRTTMDIPFSTVGVDFAGPLYYKAKKTTIGKAYICLFTCATTRAVYLKLCGSLSADDFKRALREFVARRGTPRMMVSDNAKTFVSVKEWLCKIRLDDDLHNYLAHRGIVWKFNLARAPWWGGFFERLIGTVKVALSKAIGGALLTFSELEDVLLEVESLINNRPLVYVGEEFEQEVLTPSILLHGQPTPLLEGSDDTGNDRDDLTRRLRYMYACKRNIRRRWMREYVLALEERAKNKIGDGSPVLLPGTVVLLRDQLKAMGRWKTGRITKPIHGRDGVVRGYKIRTGTGYEVEGPVQLICNLEIGGSPTNETVRVQSSEKSDKRLLPIRAAKNTAMTRISTICRNEEKEEYEDY